MTRHFHISQRLGGAARVPVGRRFLFTERRRAALTVLGVAASLLLVLVLDGIFAGAIERVTYYIKTSPATLFVSQSGVRTMHMSASALPPDTAGVAGSVPGVAWAAPIGFTSGSVAGPAGRQLSYLIGYDTDTGHGGPARFSSGSVTATIDGITYRASADYPADEIHGNEPSVALQFSPALPALQ